MWELDRNEGWAPMNGCFRTVVLEKTLESSLDSKEIKPVNLKRNQLWIFIGRISAEALILWPPDGKNWFIEKDSDAGKDWGQEEKETTEDVMAGWHHWLNRHEFEQAQGDSEGQGSLPGVLQTMESQSIRHDLPLNNKNKKNASGTKSGDKIELKEQQLYLKWCWLGRTSYFRRTMCVEWRRQWHPAPGLLPGKSHGRRNLVGCSPWDHEELDTTERFHFHFSLSCLGEGNDSPLQCSCLENPRDRGAWWASIYGVHRVGHDWSDLAAAACAWKRPRSSDSKVLSALSISNGIWRSLYFLLSCFAFFYTEHLNIIFITLKEFPNVLKGGKERYVLCKFMYLLI